MLKIIPIISLFFFNGCYIDNNDIVTSNDNSTTIETVLTNKKLEQQVIDLKGN